MATRNQNFDSQIPVIEQILGKFGIKVRIEFPAQPSFTTRLTNILTSMWEN